MNKRPKELIVRLKPSLNGFGIYTIQGERVETVVLKKISKLTAKRTFGL